MAADSGSVLRPLTMFQKWEATRILVRFGAVQNGILVSGLSAGLLLHPDLYQRMHQLTIFVGFGSL